MADTFELEIATPSRLLVKEQVDEAEVPGKDGYLGILPGHAPLLGELGPGLLTYKQGGQTHSLVVDGGFIEVFENHLSVLAEHAEWTQDIQVDTARQDADGAREQLGKAQTEEETSLALNELNRAQARIDAAGK